MPPAGGQVRNTASRNELLIWTPDGVWFQYDHPERGIVSSYLGHQSQTGIETFAREHGIPVQVYRSLQCGRRGGRGGVNGE